MHSSTLVAAVIGFNAPSLQVSWCTKGQVSLFSMHTSPSKQEGFGEIPPLSSWGSPPHLSFWTACFHFLCVQGRCVVTVQLTEEEVAADDGDVDYFLLFVGSTQRHLTSTLRSNHDTLQALCPGKPTHTFTAMRTIMFNPAKLEAKHLYEDLTVKRENQEEMKSGFHTPIK